jgi:hypothetical protein
MKRLAKKMKGPRDVDVVRSSGEHQASWHRAIRIMPEGGIDNESDNENENACR